MKARYITGLKIPRFHDRVGSIPTAGIQRKQPLTTEKQKTRQGQKWPLFSQRSQMRTFCAADCSRVASFMRAAIVFVFVLLAGCRDECVDYARVFCGRASLCKLVPAAELWTPADADACVEATVEQMDATRQRDQDSCKAAREAILSMTCAELREAAASVAER